MGGSKRLNPHRTACGTYRFELDAMHRQTRPDLRRPAARHDVASQWSSHHERSRHLIAKRYVPDLRTAGIVDRHWLTGNGRGLAGVGVAREVDELGTGGAHFGGVLCACWLAPPGVVVERDLCAAEARCG